MTFSITDHQIAALEELHQNIFDSTINFEITIDDVDYSFAYYMTDGGYDDDLTTFAIDNFNPGAYMLTESPLSANPYIPQEIIDELGIGYIQERIAIYIFREIADEIISTVTYFTGTLYINGIFDNYYRSDYPDYTTLTVAEQKELALATQRSLDIKTEAKQLYNVLKGYGLADNE